MSTPQSAEEWVVRLNARSADAGDRRDFERWVQASGKNRAAYEDALAVWRAAPHLSPTPQAGRLRAEARSFLDRTEPGGRRWWIPQAVVASVASIALLFSIRSGPAERHLQTAVGQVEHVRLTDGTELDISPETELSVTFRRSVREIHLSRGEVFFSVGHGDSRPFIVLVGATEIRDIGTRFDVAADRGQMDIAVAEGSIRVSTETSFTARGPVVTAGDALHVDAAGHYSDLPHTDPSRIAAWRTGWLSYDRTPLRKIVREVNPFSTKKLIIADPQLADLELGGVFRTNDVASLVTSLKDIYGIQARSSGDTVELYGRSHR